MGKDFLAGLKNIVGGELTAYTELLEEARQEALERMIAKASALGADAVVGVRFSTSNIAVGASELFVYGTAVKAVPNHHATHALHTPTQNGADLPRFNPFGQD